MKNRREFIREKRRQIKVARKVHGDLQWGCAMNGMFDGTSAFYNAVWKMGQLLDEMEAITKEAR